MRFDFEYTFQDLDEFTLAAASAGKTTAHKPHPIRSWILFGVLAVVVLGLWSGSRPHRPSAATPPETPSEAPDELGLFRRVILPALPFPVIFVAFYIYARAKLSAGRSSEANPQVQQPQSLEFSASGVSLRGPLAITDWKCAAFNGFSETPNLILLKQIRGPVVIMPKRAAIDDKQLEELRQLLRSSIHTAGAFPVIQ